jgi:hypothetical protein
LAEEVGLAQYTATIENTYSCIILFQKIAKGLKKTVDRYIYKRIYKISTPVPFCYLPGVKVRTAFPITNKLK